MPALIHKLTRATFLIVFEYTGLSIEQNMQTMRRVAHGLGKLTKNSLNFTSYYSLLQSISSPALSAALPKHILNTTHRVIKTNKTTAVDRY